MLVGLDRVVLDPGIEQFIFHQGVFDRICHDGCDERAQTSSPNKKSEQCAGDASPMLGTRGGPNSPSDPGRPNAVGQVERARHDTDRIKDRPHNAKCRDGGREGTGRIVGGEFGTSERFRDVGHPPLEMKPTMQMKDMRENECKRDIACDPLERVSSVSRKAIMLQIRLARPRNPNARYRVENDRNEDKGPLDHRQHRQAMDRMDIFLKHRRSGHQARVGQQVDAHVRPDRNQATERMKSTNEEVISLQKTTRHSGGRRRTHTCFGSNRGTGVSGGGSAVGKEDSRQTSCTEYPSFPLSPRACAPITTRIIGQKIEPRE